MSSNDFFDALRAVLVREIEGCTDLNSVDRLSGGASMETYRLSVKVHGQEVPMCLRRGAGGVNRDTVSAVGLSAEALLMRLAKSHGVPEPEIYCELQPEDGVGVGFIMEWLDGETLGSRIVRSPDLEQIRDNLAEQCGQELAKIHAIDVDSNNLRTHLPELTPSEYVEQTWSRYRDWNTAQPMIDFTGRWLNENLPPECQPRLVHNDFRNGNLMVDTTLGISAVLDWETSHIGDPMRDLGWICTNSWRFGNREMEVGGFGRLEDLIRGYEKQSGEKLDRSVIKFWEVFGSFWWSIGCLGMTDQYRSGPDATVERPAIGRRSSECQVDCVNLLIPGPVDLVGPNNFARPTDMPRLDELLTSVKDFLHQDVMEATSGRTNFLSRVAGNSLDIVQREVMLGPALAKRERADLESLLKKEGSLEDLRWTLVHQLRDGSIPLDKPGLADYLRTAVVNQVAIDQPKYSGFVFAASSGNAQ